MAFWKLVKSFILLVPSAFKEWNFEVVLIFVFFSLFFFVILIERNEKIIGDICNIVSSTNYELSVSRIPQAVHGRPNARLHLHQVQQVLQDVEQLSQAQVRATAVQVFDVPVRCL